MHADFLWDCFLSLGDVFAGLLVSFITFCLPPTVPFALLSSTEHPALCYLADMGDEVICISERPVSTYSASPGSRGSILGTSIPSALSLWDQFKIHCPLNCSPFNWVSSTVPSLMIFIWGKWLILAAVWWIDWDPADEDIPCLVDERRGEDLCIRAAGEGHGASSTEPGRSASVGDDGIEERQKWCLHCCLWIVDSSHCWGHHTWG